jgi:putative ABC transport system permease protein
MIWSILTFQFRNFFRNISFSSIVLSSLVVGITTSLLLFLWVKYELNYNKSVIDHDRIFALLLNDEVEGEIHTDEGTDIALMDFLSHQVPEIEAVSRVNNKNMVLAYGEKSIHRTGIYADSGFFAVHVAERFQGNATLALTNGRSIALSETLAKELFGDIPAIGKTVLVDKKTEFAVSAIFAPYPINSSFKYINFVLPISGALAEESEWVNHDIKLFDASSRKNVEEKINQKIVQLNPTDNTTSLLFAVSDWRLRWSFENGKQSGGRIVYVVIFAVTGLFVLIMACINYMNISTARANRRMREIGIRKVTGATQRLLVRQFMVHGRESDDDKPGCTAIACSRQPRFAALQSVGGLTARVFIF